jgi:hypothetical protein
MNSAEVQGTIQLPYPHKQERQRRKDQSWRRLATVNKIAQVKGWNLPTYREKRNLESLLNLYGEYAYLTGKHLGTYYLSTLDLDIQRAEFPIKLVNRLVKNMARLLDYLQVSYDKTKKGLHLDILTLEPLNNETIYWIDKLGKKWNIGSIQSLGKYVVGEDSDKAFIQVSKWYWKVKSNQEVKKVLSKFFFNLGELRQSTTQKTPLSITKNPKQPALFNPSTKFTTIQAKILSIWDTKLEQTRKFFYLNCQTQQTEYFLLNDYHREKVNLSIGSTQNILLVNGRKHRFFSRLI